eukprot:14617926-Alexandrium_andersonii.AAC.1
MESQRNMIDAMREQAAAAQAQSAALVANASAAAAAPADPSAGGSGAPDERLNALAGIKLEQTMPFIKTGGGGQSFGGGGGSGTGGQQRTPPNPNLPCPFGSRCNRLGRPKYPNGRGYKHDPSEHYRTA